MIRLSKAEAAKLLRKSGDRNERVLGIVAEAGQERKRRKARAKLPDQSETKLVKACLEYLHARGVFAYRNNVGAVKIGNRFVRFGIAGLPDIIAIAPANWPRPGVFIGLECKVAGNKLTNAQYEMQQRINKVGGACFTVRSLDELCRLFP